MRPDLRKKTIIKRAGGVGQGEGPEFKPQYWEKKKKKRTPEKVQRSRGLF
jgi:hypothetical protein